MNYRGKRRLVPLGLCRVCGMDAGVRKMINKVPEEFFVECQICGFKTKRHKSLQHATRDWNGGNHE